MSKKRKIFISCGELSGEVHAANLALELFKLDDNIEIHALGSTLLEEIGVNIAVDYSEYSFSGISEVVANLGKVFELKDKVIKAIQEIEPDIVLLVDYGGFNLELAKTIKDKNLEIPVYEYIAPQVWASRPWRIKKIKKYVDKVFCTLPFEEELYKKNKIPVKYVGNPVLPSLTNAISKEDFLNTFDYRNNEKNKETDLLIGLFPGSRNSEIKYMLPIMLDSIRALKAQSPNTKYRFILARAPNIKTKTLEACGYNANEKLIEILEPDHMLNANHKLLSAADALWLCSGTVTLEAALYTTPYFLAYKSTKVNYFLYLIFKTINMAGLANIIAGEYLVKEFLQDHANSKNFIEETQAWFEEGSYSNYYKEIKSKLSNLRDKISGMNTAKMVAEEIYANT